MVFGLRVEFNGFTFSPKYVNVASRIERNTSVLFTMFFSRSVLTVELIDFNVSSNIRYSLRKLVCKITFH